MRLLKYNSPPDPMQRSLEKQRQRLLRREKFYFILSVTVFLLVAVVILHLGVLFLRYCMFTEPAGSGWAAFFRNAKGTVWMICVIFFSLGLGLCAALPILTMNIKAQPPAPEVYARRQDFRRRCCQQLQQHYGFQKPYWVTKCFDCTGRGFRGRDVCLFFVDGELRITGDLHSGYFRPEQDPGCYCLSREETTVRTVQWEERTAMELTAGNVRFLLGIRALPFLEKMWELNTEV